MKNARTLMPIGLWPRGTQVDVVWFEKSRLARAKPHLNLAPEARTATLSLAPESTLMSRIISEMIKPPKVEPLFISAVLPSSVWERSIVVPQTLSEAECEEQCRNLLANELPVPLDKVWFDFHPTPLKQGTLIEMSAVLIEHAQAQTAKFGSTPVRILDSASHALSRAFEHLMPTLPKDALHLYADDDYAIAFQQKGYDFNILQISEANLTALFAQYCERFQFTPDSVCFYMKNENAEQIAELTARGWLHCQTKLPLIALGLALWHLDF